MGKSHRFCRAQLGTEAQIVPLEAVTSYRNEATGALNDPIG